MTVQNNLVEGVGGLASGTAGRSQPSALPVGHNKLEPSPLSGAVAVDQEALEFRKAGGVVAAFYYGEWATPGPVYNPTPWVAIQPYSGRLPLASRKIASGVYGLPADDAKAVAWEQRAAKGAGIDVFVHSTYWMKPSIEDPAPFNITDAALQAHADCPEAMTFAVMWENSATPLTTLPEFVTCLTYMLSWAKDYPQNYWHINGKPVLYIYNIEKLMNDGKALFSTEDGQLAASLMVQAVRQIADDLSLPGLYLVSASGYDHPFWTGRADGYVGLNEYIGFDAQTRYNIFYANRGQVQNASGGDVDWDARWPLPLSSYDQFTTLYKMSHDWCIQDSNAQITVQAAAICGWDKRPWLERAEQQLGPEDYCAATEEQWLAHLRQQRAVAIAGTRSKPGIPPVVDMYAWNEYGEGGYLCPSRDYGYGLLRQVQQAFGLTGKPI